MQNEWNYVGLPLVVKFMTGSSQFSLLYTVFNIIVQYTLHCTIYSVQCDFNSAQCTVHSVHCSGCLRPTENSRLRVVRWVLAGWQDLLFLF